MNKVAVKRWDELADREPAYALVANVDLVVVRFDDAVSVLYGRCLHRGALLADGTVRGGDLICGVHDWDYRLDTGVSAYSNEEALRKFSAWVEDGQVLVDEDEIARWAVDHPQPKPLDVSLVLRYRQTLGWEVERVRHDPRPYVLEPRHVGGHAKSYFRTILLQALDQGPQILD